MPSAVPGLSFLMDGSIIVSDVRLSYPNLWRPRASDLMRDDGTPSPPTFNAEFLMDLGTHRPFIVELRKRMLAVAQERWGSAGKPYILPKDRGFLRDGRGTGKPERENTYFFKAAEKIAPKIIDLDKTPLKEEDGRPYGGCYVNVKISMWTNEHKKGGRRVLANLLTVQFNRPGEAFSARERLREHADEGFEAYAEEGSIDDGLTGFESDGLDEEIPL